MLFVLSGFYVIAENLTFDHRLTKVGLKVAEVRAIAAKEANAFFALADFM
jgi:hypothetical protein